MIKFITLGPVGSNHQLVVERYVQFQGLEGKASIEFFKTFAEGSARILDGSADFMLQCAVHPETVDTVARYSQGLYVIDTFISPSRDLAVIRDRRAPPPTSIALMNPTRDYTDPARWGEVVSMPTVVAVAQGLREGRFARGLTYASVAAEDPERFEVEEFIGSVDDAWIVYGRERVSGGKLLAWPGSPASKIFAHLRGSAVEVA
ncbi:MAG TPA: hypothetical protein VHA82_14335 [Ramlibacter sp.]|uniref:hypothetical protein n=1 Tax=Ramlibacter sp. TaxID=1917967 RepID=UPI002B733348|nr:hypothetical protein [Ramlibacter sp.]HVZ44986.1 hypothetical protein [Ramlibacter sp.]